MIAITLDGELNVGRITRRDLGLGHQECRSDLALQQWIKPLPLLLLAAVFGDDFHVSCIWSSAVASLVHSQHQVHVLSKLQELEPVV